MKKCIKQIILLFFIWLVSLSAYDVVHSIFSVDSSRPASVICAEIAVTEGKLAVLKAQEPLASAVIMEKRAELLLEYGKLFWADKDRIQSLNQEIEHYQTIPNQIAELEDRLGELNKELGRGVTNPEHWYSLLLSVFGIMCGRLLDAFGYTVSCIILYIPFKFFCYYVLAPVVSSRPCVSFDDASLVSSIGAERELKASEEVGEKSLSIQILPAESITIIGEEYLRGHKAQMDSNIRKRTRWLLDWRHPIMCLVCKLCMMSYFENKGENSKPFELGITSNNANEYFVCINIKQGEKYYISPSDLVALGSGVRISATWRLGSLAAWCMGQVRFFELSGAGRVVVRSLGGIIKGVVTSDADVIERKHSLICASQGVTLHVERNQTLWPVLTGEANMFDLRLNGEGTYLTSNVVPDESSSSEKVVHAFWRALGQFLGF